MDKKVSVFERLEALNQLRVMAHEVSRGFKATKAGDSYRYTGSMGAVEDLREALLRADAVEIHAMPDRNEVDEELESALDEIEEGRADG